MKKINKTTARKLFNEGKTFFMAACNMRVDSAYEIDPAKADCTFDQLLNAFNYYNCNSVAGRFSETLGIKIIFSRLFVFYMNNKYPKRLSGACLMDARRFICQWASCMIFLVDFCVICPLFLS